MTMVMKVLGEHLWFPQKVSFRQTEQKKSYFIMNLHESH